MIRVSEGEILKIKQRAENEEVSTFVRNLIVSDIFEVIKELKSVTGSMDEKDWLIFLKRVRNVPKVWTDLYEGLGGESFVQKLANKALSNNPMRLGIYLNSLVESNVSQETDKWAGYEIVPNPNGEKEKYFSEYYNTAVIVVEKKRNGVIVDTKTIKQDEDGWKTFVTKL